MYVYVISFTITVLMCVYILFIMLYCYYVCHVLLFISLEFVFCKSNSCQWRTNFFVFNQTINYFESLSLVLLNDDVDDNGNGGGDGDNGDFNNDGGYDKGGDCDYDAVVLVLILTDMTC